MTTHPIHNKGAYRRGTCLLEAPSSRTLLMLLLLVPVFVFGHEEHQELSPSIDSENHHGTPEKPHDVHVKENEQREHLEQDQKEKQVEDNHDHSTHVSTEGAKYKKFIQWIGNFHPISIHFPIALIIMTGFSEFLFLWFPLPIFSNASRFMIIAAAITSIPTVLFGLALGYEAVYKGALSSILWWHQFSGISTSILAVSSAVLKELYVRKRVIKIGYYYTALVISVLFVMVTSYLGGELTFGLFHMFRGLS